jgi:hypothetical protein
VRCLVNGEVRQQSTTALMIYSISHIIAHISRFMTLEPGDLIMTGTPAGVGPVRPGDVMTVEVEGLPTVAAVRSMLLYPLTDHIQPVLLPSCIVATLSYRWPLLLLW